MRVYRIQSDVNRYRFVVGRCDEDSALLAALDGTPRAHNWTPPSVRVFDPRLKIGDFYQFMSNVLILSDRAVQALRPHLMEAGELLPLQCEGLPLTLLNVTNLIDCLTPQLVEDAIIHDTLILEAEPLRRSPAALFKIPRLATAYVFVVEGARPPEDEVRAVVGRAQLRGVEWEEVWTDEDGPGPARVPT